MDGVRQRRGGTACGPRTKRQVGSGHPGVDPVRDNRRSPPRGRAAGLVEGRLPTYESSCNIMNCTVILHTNSRPSRLSLVSPLSHSPPAVLRGNIPHLTSSPPALRTPLRSLIDSPQARTPTRATAHSLTQTLTVTAHSASERSLTGHVVTHPQCNVLRSTNNQRPSH